MDVDKEEWSGRGRILGKVETRTGSLVKDLQRDDRVGEKDWNNQ